MTKTTEEHGLISSVQQLRRTNHKDFQNCLFACFLSQKEPKKVLQALEDPSWVEAMQNELLQFKLLNVWSLVDLPRDKWEIGPKSMVYVDDIIFGSTKKEMSTEFEKLMHGKIQMSSMGELSFFLGLQVNQKSDGIFISQDKYVDEILKKFDLASIKIASTPMETNKPLTKDEEAKNVDVHLYRSMIGSLMYLTASRPDIMFAVCTCARFQVTPKTSHLHAVKRIFSDYAGASLDKKSTIGGCQFLGKRLISWQCKKQTIVANSTTEAGIWWLTANLICGQVGDEAVHKELGDRMERAATTASSSEAEQDSGSGPRCQDTILGDVDAQTRLILVMQLNAAKHKVSTAGIQLMLLGLNRGAEGRGGEGEGEEENRGRKAKDAHVLNLENAKSDHAIEIASLKKRVDKLEKRRQLRTTGLTRFNKFGTAKRVKSSNASLGAQEDASKQGRSIEDIDADAELLLLVLKIAAPTIQVSTADIGDSAAPRIQVSTAGIGEVTTAKIDELTLAQTLIEIKVAKPKVVTTAAINKNSTSPKASKEKKAKGSKETAKGNRKKMLRRKRVGKQQNKNSQKQKLGGKEKVSDEVEEKSVTMLIRPNGSSKRYSSMIRMLQGIDREDLEVLWRIVKAKHNDTRPEDEFERVLWGDLTVSLSYSLPVEVKTPRELATHYHSAPSDSHNYAAGYKDTTVADLQLLEDLLLSGHKALLEGERSYDDLYCFLCLRNEVCTASIVQYWTRHIFVLGYQEISDRQMEKHTHSFGSRIDQDASFKGKLTD
ncbi:uncharacterized mitochondrial protein-like protein [Tanacetum coccineum]